MKELLRAIPFTLRVLSNDRYFKKSDDGCYYSGDLKVEVKLESIPGTNATRQTNTVTNLGKDDVLLTGFSSSAIKTVRGKIGVDRNRWQSEGQWSFFTPEQCGLVPATIHPWETEKYEIASVGSWSTGVFYPLTVVIGEDGYSYFMEVEGSHNWQLIHSLTGSLTNPMYFLEGSACHEENGGWNYLLKPSESYTTQPAFFGRVQGGFEEVCAELVAVRRALTLKKFENDVIPVVFNDYMNCLWGQPSDAKLLPLIDAAAKVGCEYFCIDAGWHKNANGALGAKGDWLVANERFGEIGLQGVFDHMKARGLKPGVWFELEYVMPDAAIVSLGEDAFLTRYSKPVNYHFFNFENEKVREHLHSRIDELYGMGVRYIKNDYNRTTGIGADNYGRSPSEGLIRNYLAFTSFIDEVMDKHPDLVIENCGSGACRSDNGTLSHFYLQSTSDQEIYYWYPSIIIGSAAQYAPEKAGIWSYPMPVGYDERETCDYGDSWRARFTDGEETIFNMVNGMCGALYQSGHLEHSDEKNLALVAEGIAQYKKMRSDIVTSHPILPSGTCYIGDYCVASLGLETPDKSRAYLAVWNIGTGESEVKIDLKKYGYAKASAWYPSFTECALDDGVLTVKTNGKFSARMVLLEK